MDLDKFRTRAEGQAPENKRFLQKLKKLNPGKVDEFFHHHHEEVFSELDCLECANCCKTTSPIFYPNDIERAASVLKIKPGLFMDRYLKTDEDGDYVLKNAPCPFLGKDNSCQIYKDRPKACREYPHTNRKKMVQILNLTYRNTFVCPAVLEIVNKIKEKLPANSI